MKVKKYSGDLVTFDPESLKHSLLKSGASHEDVAKVYERIQKELYEGITTQQLYEKAFAYLKDIRKVYAAKYSLKKALRDLGPTGYNFEKWVCSLMRYMGYQSINSQVLKGHAVTHEIDVIAIKDEEFYIAECKLRNDPDAKITVTTPMYFLSRMNDLADLPFHFFGESKCITKGWLITNAYFTTDSIDFGEYYGINLLSWDYPEGKSIKNLTDDGGLYPITCLTTLDEMYKLQLLDHHIILVSDLITRTEILGRMIKNKQTYEDVLAEAKELMKLH
jgi:hypothetical protein